MIDLGPLDVGTKSCSANGAFERRRIVARFEPKGKPVPAWKSRIFNHLRCSFFGNLAGLARRGSRHPIWTGPETTVSLWNEAGL